MIPEPGHRIEFLSDLLTDKGPATGEVTKVEGESDSAKITVRFGDEEQSFSWKELDDAGADVRGGLWLVKAHIKGYSRKDGVYVKPHERQGSPTHYPDAKPHPQIGENGKSVTINKPHHPSTPSTWHSPDGVATFVPGGDIPLSLNGVRISPWRDHPQTLEGWDYVDGVDDNLDEPPFRVPPGKNASSGVVIEEPDGRVWLIHPTNRFGGYKAAFPKGTEEPELSLQANAIKEAFEETGLQVEITGYIGDYTRTTSVCRMYRAKRVGGDPTSMGWETQAVSLVPKGLLYDHLNMWSDHGIAEDIGAGPAPKPEKRDRHADSRRDSQGSMF